MRIKTAWILAVVGSFALVLNGCNGCNPTQECGTWVFTGTPSGNSSRPAPVFDSQEAMVYEQYKYRVCDYALFFLEQIAGKQDFRMPVSPAERDVVIKEMSAK